MQQITALWRRGIVVPRDAEAEAVTRSGFAEREHAAMVVGLDDAAFTALWGTGFFREINRIAGTCIDDYEEEWVPGRSLPDIERALALVADWRGSGTEQLVADIRRACAEAKDRGVGLMFVL